MARTRPPSHLGLLVLLLVLTSRLQCCEATLDSGRAEHIRPAFAAFDTRIDHKLIAAATLRASDAPAADYKAISKSAAECSEATPGAVRTREAQGPAVVADTH